MSIIGTLVPKKSYLKAVAVFARFYSHQNPFQRTLKIISQDVSDFFGKKKTVYNPEHTDIVVIGGGIIGSATAYWLKTRAGKGLSVTVLEKDLTYKSSRRDLSLGRLHQHFSLPENINLSLYTAEFLRNINELLENNEINIQFRPTGNLVLASEKYAEQMEHNVVIQQEFGIKNELLTPETIKKRYPWINTTDVALGSVGTESEGFFSTWALLKGFVEKAQDLGAIYVNAEVTGFSLTKQKDLLMEGVAPGSYQKLNKLTYRTSDGEERELQFAGCVLAAGEASTDIAKMAKVGTESGLLSIPLPIEKRSHKVHSISKSGFKVGMDTPIVADTSGLWMRRNGLQSDIICGHVPLSDSDNEDFFNNYVKPALANRVPALADARISEVDAEWHDYNTYDDTGILGPHPYHNNMYIATGFGSLGYQHAPGIGRAIAELLIDRYFDTIDLTRFSFDRLLTAEPMIENNVY